MNTEKGGVNLPMIEKNYKSFVLVILILASVFVLTACTARNINPRQPGQPDTTGQGQNMMQKTAPDANRIQAPDGRTQTAPVPTPLPQLQQGNMADYNRKAEAIKSKLEAMKEVDSASVVVVGNTALVGCKTSKESKNADTTRNLIINKVKATDKNIENVTVAESADLSAQVKRISDDIRNNKPVDEINASINKIMREINPKTP